MKIYVDSASGGESIDIDLSTADDDRLNALASAGSIEAREELKKRTGLDAYKELGEITDGDVADYLEWLKNNDTEKYNKIVGSSKDVE